MKKPVILTIIDGLGYSDQVEGNAWKQAHTPTLDYLLKHYPNSVLGAAGEAVGLPPGQIGNSEVGHLNIGAGQVVYTGLSLIQKALDDKTFYQNPAFFQSVKHAQKHNSTIHVMGLLSPGGVHSLETHAFAILDFLHQQKITKVTFHAFTDGRDVAPRSVKPSLVKLMSKLNQYNYKLGSIAGRLYAMDRDKIFVKTQEAYQMLQGQAKNTFTNPLSYIDSQYEEKDLNDEFIECAINEDNSVRFLKNNDALIFFNFRPDRARQLAHLLVGSELYEDLPVNALENLQMSIMMPYEGINNVAVAFGAMSILNPIGKIISMEKLKQLRIAETQKYAHVTFFMDGGADIQYPNTDRIIVESAKVENFATLPEMSAQEITDRLIAVLPQYDFVIMNYANPDMVGHTGNLPATIQALEILDKELARLYQAVKDNNGTIFLTADHGNAEIMLDQDHKPVTKHTTSDVFLVCTDSSVTLKNGVLANVAPTILDYMHIQKPESMTHKSLLGKK